MSADILNSFGSSLWLTQVTLKNLMIHGVQMVISHMATATTIDTAKQLKKKQSKKFG